MKAHEKYFYDTNPADIYRCPVFFTGFKVAKFEFVEDKTPSKRPFTYMSAAPQPYSA